MTGYQSKRLVTNRYADPVTLDHIVDLRKENERLREALLDLEQYVSRADHFYLKPETLAVLKEVE